MKTLSLLVALSISALLNAQHTHVHRSTGKIFFPDIPGYQTLVCDLHQHTVFSDGHVWPTIRVQEAIKEGVEVISITDHLEYQPKIDDIPHPDRNRSYKLATEADHNNELLILNGVEVTRKMPPGHCNAIFIKDANKLMENDPMKVFAEAKNQGAFVFWNHPHWVSQAPDGVAKLHDMHKELISKGLIQGVEVVNEHIYSDEALQIALDNNLAILGTSDIHGLVDWEFNLSQGGHRPVTLVFAKEKTEESLKQGLLDRKTVVYYKDKLIGKEENLVPLIHASLEIEPIDYKSNSNVARVGIKNVSCVPYLLQNKSNFTFHTHGDIVTLLPGHTTTIEVKTIDKKSSFDLTFEVLNAIKAPGQHPEITLTVK